MGTVGALTQRQLVRLVDGASVEGIVLLQGPRGVVLAVDSDKQIERFVPVESIERIEPALPSTGETLNPDESGSVMRFAFGPREGSLRIVAQANAAELPKPEASLLPKPNPVAPVAPVPTAPKPSVNQTGETARRLIRILTEEGVPTREGTASPRGSEMPWEEKARTESLNLIEDD
ncbi:MAG: hypothetical protein V1918_10595 [Planctomycetota bacterium]